MQFLFITLSLIDTKLLIKMRNLTILLLFLSVKLFSQNIAAFSDYQKAFYVFDDGKMRQLEYQPVISYQIGDKCIGYETNGRGLKIYYNHIDYDITSMVSKYKVTKNLVTYTVGTQLYVFEDGIKKNLSRFVGHYQEGDSIVGFFDTENYYLQVFYHGEIITIADGLLYENTRAFIVGSDMLAFIDAYQNFKVFYQGKIYDVLQSDVVVSAKIGRSVMAFIDPVTDFLQVFYKGELLELETFLPKSFQVGYEKVAYIDNMDEFKLFDDGELYTVSDFKPDEYMLKDDLLVYKQQGQLWVFYKGENILIENYIPVSYKIRDDAIAYIDQNGHLNVVEEGGRKVLTYEKINDYSVLGNIVIYNQGTNTTKIYYNGETYTK